MNDLLLNLEVTARIAERGGVVAVDLVDPRGGSLPPFTAGAHIDLHLGEGLVRRYSLMNDPAERRRYRLGVLLEPNSRGGSAAVHARLVLGAAVTAGPPRNHFPLASEAERSILVGGGIGVTPMLAMAHALHAQGRDFVLHYCTRTADRTPFLDELSVAPFAAKVRLHHDEGLPPNPFRPERDLAPLRPGVHCYVCGPAGFMDWVIGAAKALGYPPERIHREYFSAEIDAAGAGFEVVAARSGLTLQVAEGQSIAEVLAAHGLAVETSCEEGVCGTCLVEVLEGEPDHRDVYLTDAEKRLGDQILVCCSRARSKRLVLNL